MPRFEIEQYELHVQTYRVEAEDEAHAIQRLFESEADPVEGSLEFVEVAEDFGLPAEEYTELARALRKRDIKIGDVIPSVREVRAV